MSENFVENKNKTKTFWGSKPSKIENIEPHQNFTYSDKKEKCINNYK